MRGKDILTIVRMYDIRITPAYAGKRANRWVMYTLTEDHPRLCGEKEKFTTFSRGSVGSPPPMRGKDKFPNAAFRFSGITPAYAGKSFGSKSLIGKSTDHPRLCGEKGLLCCVFNLHKGSPPPMRGKENKMKKYDLASRITPAYAGKR